VKLKNDMYRICVLVSGREPLDILSPVVDWMESVIENCFRFNRNDPFTY
jgi:hypothetical protein